MSRNTWLYFPGAADGGIREPHMTEGGPGDIVIRGNEILRADFGSPPVPLAFCVDGLWYEADDYGHLDGRRLVYIETEDCP